MLDVEGFIQHLVESGQLAATAEVTIEVVHATPCAFGVGLACTCEPQIHLKEVASDLPCPAAPINTAEVVLRQLEAADITPDPAAIIAQMVVFGIQAKFVNHRLAGQLARYLQANASAMDISARGFQQSMLN